MAEEPSMELASLLEAIGRAEEGERAGPLERLAARGSDWVGDVLDQYRADLGRLRRERRRWFAIQLGAAALVFGAFTLLRLRSGWGDVWCSAGMVAAALVLNAVGLSPQGWEERQRRTPRGFRLAGARAALASHDDPRAIPALARPGYADWLPAEPELAGVLARQALRLRELDPLPIEVKESLPRVLDTLTRQTGADYDEEAIKATLAAMARGTVRAGIVAVDRVAFGDALHPEQKRVRTVARTLLPEVEAAARHAAAHEKLVRPSAGPHAADTALLRPASSAPATDEAALLRPAVGDATGERAQLVRSAMPEGGE